MIDVGYAGVIGADKISDGEPLYGDFPEDNSHGDTYGPLAYYAYQPFEQLFPWTGSWDDLPAAHAASIFFDLATAALLLLARNAAAPGTERKPPGQSCSRQDGQHAHTRPSRWNRTQTTRSSRSCW